MRTIVVASCVLVVSIHIDAMFVSLFTLNQNNVAVVLDQIMKYEA